MPESGWSDTGQFEVGYPAPPEGEEPEVVFMAPSFERIVGEEGAFTRIYFVRMWL